MADPKDPANWCPKCRGEGRVANSDDQEPWSVWENLPEESKLAVHPGIVQPVECPVCEGNGMKPAEQPAAAEDDRPRLFGHPIIVPISPQEQALRDELTTAAEAIAELHRITDGADPTPPDEGERLTHGQFWHRLLTMDREGREEIIRNIYGAYDAREQCLMSDHARQISQLSERPTQHAYEAACEALERRRVALADALGVRSTLTLGFTELVDLVRIGKEDRNQLAHQLRAATDHPARPIRDGREDELRDILFAITCDHSAMTAPYQQGMTLAQVEKVLERLDAYRRAEVEREARNGQHPLPAADGSPRCTALFEKGTPGEAQCSLPDNGHAEHFNYEQPTRLTWVESP